MQTLFDAGRLALCVALTLLSTACSHTATEPTATPATALTGTAWQLIRFASGDDTVLTPDDRSKYTLAFVDAQVIAVRFDCNRGRGGWKSTDAGRLEFGPMALTRAYCAQGSLHDDMVKRWPYIRTYVLRDGRLFLAMEADGGVFEFEHIPN